MRPAAAPKKTRFGPYEIERQLGSGGMAEVYLAHRAGPHGFSKKVAIKRILPRYANDPNIVQMFCDEARISARLSHPNIAQVVDFGEEEDELFIVMEYVDGLSCAKVLAAATEKNQVFPIDAALYVTWEVLNALSFAHEACDEDGHSLRIVHRDVSPSNILISRTGSVKLIDFGVTRSRIMQRQTIPGELRGKLRYMSPEQIIGAELDGRSDLFAVGIVLAEMLTGKKLFSGANELDILTRVYRGDLAPLARCDIAEPLQLVLRRALSHRPENRFQTAREFSRMIAAVALDEGILLDDRVLVPWLHGLGVFPALSGARPINDAPSIESRPQPEAPALEARAARTAVAIPRQPDTPEIGPNTASAETLSEPGRARLRSRERRRLSPLPDSAAALAALRGTGGYRPKPDPPPLPAAETVRLRGKTGLTQPIPRQRLLELIATGRVNQRTSCTRDGTRFAPLESIESLRALFSRHPYRFREPAASRAEWRRPLRRAGLPRLLYALVAERRTGLLVAQDGRMQKRIYWERGDPVYAASTQRGELLGQRLVAAGLVTPAVLDRALGKQQNERLGEVLVGMGALGPARLLREVVAQLEHRFVELSAWQGGEVLFFSGVRHGEVAMRPSRTTHELIGSLVRDHYDASDLLSTLAPLAPQPLERTPRRSEASRLGLQPREFAALELAPQAESLRTLTVDLPARGIASLSEVLRAVFIALSADVLRARGWPQAVTVL